jgi:hypothetical protein
MIRLSPYLFLVLIVLTAGPVYANCASPAGKTADVIYSSAYHTYQFCNGTSWIAFVSGSAWTKQSNNNPTPAAGSGYFVMSGTQWNGSLGGRSGADSKCLTELTSTYTNWKGYSTALAAGYLISANIHALLCDTSACTNLMASTTYNFAVANNHSAGGATFTTNSSGYGPNDSANWSAANYFSNSNSYWTNMGVTSNTVWNGSPASNSINSSCSSWTTASSGTDGVIASSSNSVSVRWYNGGNNLPCNNTFNLICFVNP